MLSRLHNIDTSAMDAATKAKLDDTLAALTRLANIRENPVTLPQLTTYPAVPATLPKLTTAGKIVHHIIRPLPGISPVPVIGQAAQRGQSEAAQ